MNRRRALVAGGVVVALLAVLAGVWDYRSSHRAPVGCDTVHSLISYNNEFSAKMRDSTAADKAGAVTPQQYRDWATKVRDYAASISNPDLAGNANTAADIAGRIADLVPRYRAKPDDPAAAREYAGLGIEFGNAINRLEYSCLPVG